MFLYYFLKASPNVALEYNIIYTQLCWIDKELNFLIALNMKINIINYLLAPYEMISSLVSYIFFDNRFAIS